MLSIEPPHGPGSEYFQIRRPLIQNGPATTYAQTMSNLFDSALFREGKVASNETFTNLVLPQFRSLSFCFYYNFASSILLLLLYFCFCYRCLSVQ
jgi:hypothetical protein